MKSREDIAVLLDGRKLLHKVLHVLSMHVEMRHLRTNDRQCNERQQVVATDDQRFVVLLALPMDLDSVTDRLCGIHETLALAARGQ